MSPTRLARALTVEPKARKMSLVDKSHENREPAFARAFDGEAAHRQLKVSLLLVTATTIAAFVLGLALPLHAAHAVHGPATLRVNDR